MKKIMIPIVCFVILLFILFAPVPRGTYKDGGTKEYAALTYKIVKWNRVLDDGEIYDKTSVYWGKNAYKSIDGLWEETVKPELKEDTQVDEAEHTFNARIIEVINGMITVEPLIGEEERKISDSFTFSADGIDIPNRKDDYHVTVSYVGSAKESYPAQIEVLDCKFTKKERLFNFDGVWIDRTGISTNYGVTTTEAVVIELYRNCFMAREVNGRDFEIKLIGEYPDDICVGDYITLTYSEFVTDETSKRLEASFVSLTVHEELTIGAKPVIYLYPEEETEISVNLDYSGELTCTYPEYNDGWTVTAKPDGTLTDADGKEYNYLYWEGETDTKWDFSSGFCIKGENTAEFLEVTLEKLGLTRREANEFIVYWLPLMQENEYNVISFQTDVYEEEAKLEVSPSPDTVIRVFMAYKDADEFVELPKQELTAPERSGFTVIEWGGTEVE